MKRYETGLIVGEFCPLHKGHEYLIETALKACEQLIIISYSNPGYSGCETEKRRAWLEALYPETTGLVVDDAWLLENTENPAYTHVPHDDVDEDIHRRFTAWLSHIVLGKTVEAIFTSEDYGDGFAQLMTEYQAFPAKHICVDKAREAVPITGTRIRKNPFKYREYLSDIVAASFVKKAVFLGGESTGKSTLAAKIAAHLNTQFVPEYGRELWDKKNGALIYEDMLHIAQTQIEAEDELTRISDEWLFCDTSPLTTLFYSQSMFGKAEPDLMKLSERRYEATFLCYPDFEFVQDGTRQDPSFRDAQHGWYERELAERGIDYTPLYGSLEQRIETVIKRFKFLD